MLVYNASLICSVFRSILWTRTTTSSLNYKSSRSSRDCGDVDSLGFQEVTSLSFLRAAGLPARPRGNRGPEYLWMGRWTTSTPAHVLSTSTPRLAIVHTQGRLVHHVSNSLVEELAVAAPLPPDARRPRRGRGRCISRDGGREVGRSGDQRPVQEARRTRRRPSMSRWTWTLLVTSPAIFRCAWRTVVWSLPPKCSPT